jgi:hypothetical protein
LRIADRGLRIASSGTWRAFWISLFAVGAIAVLLVGWQGGEPFTAAAFVVFFSSRVARSIVKRPLTPTVHSDPIRHANLFLGVTAIGWFGAGALAAIAALTGEGGEWLYVTPFFLLMGALQLFVMLWAGRVVAPASSGRTARNIVGPVVAVGVLAAAAAIAVAYWPRRERAAPLPVERAQRLTYELVAARGAGAGLRIRNLDAFTWTRVRTIVGQGDEHAYVCDVLPAVAPRAVLTVDLGRCLSDEGLTPDTLRPVTTFTVRAAEGTIDSRRP